MMYDWNSVAAAAAMDIKENLGTTLCGAVEWHRPGIAVAFGNDGYEQDERTHEEVNWLRYRLPLCGAPILGFGLCDAGHTWALVVQTNDVAWLNAVVLRAWSEANPFEPAAWRRSVIGQPWIEWPQLDMLQATA